MTSITSTNRRCTAEEVCPKEDRFTNDKLEEEVTRGDNGDKKAREQES